MNNPNVKIEIEKLDEANPAALYHCYPDELYSQNAYIQLNIAARTAAWDWDSEVGSAVPESVWNGRTPRWYCPGWVPTAEAANELSERLHDYLADYVRGDVQARGYAHDEIERILERCDCEAVNAIDAGEWLEEGWPEGVPAVTADSDLPKIAREIRSYALDEGVHVLDNLDDYLEELADEAREAE